MILESSPVSPTILQWMFRVPVLKAPASANRGKAFQGEQGSKHWQYINIIIVYVYIHIYIYTVPVFGLHE